MSPPLRPYQARAVDWTHETWAHLRLNGRRSSVVLQLPTGGGKTRILEALAPELVIAPGIDLVDQLRRRIPGARVVTIQGLARAMAEGRELPPGRVVALDEARWACAPQWAPVVRHYLAQGTSMVMVDATPATANGRGLGGVAEELYQVASMRELIAGGHLVPFKVLAPPDRGQLAASPLDAYRWQTPDESAIVFAENKAHAAGIVESFAGAGISAALITDDTAAKQRRWVIKALVDGSLKVAVCAQILRQGIDVPRVSSIILARGVGSYPLWMQAVGRGGRPFEGKQCCTVLDLRGAVHLHGLPEEPRIWGLDGTSLPMGTALPGCVQCLSCWAWGRGGRCEICGASLPPPAAPKVQSRPLTEITAERQISEEVKREQLGRWVREYIARGKDPRAAKHKFKGVHKTPTGPLLDLWVREAISEARKLRASLPKQANFLGGEVT